MADSRMILADNPQDNIINNIRTKCPEIEKDATFTSPFDLTNIDELLAFAINKICLEILDASHDLACDKDQFNPLVLYCNKILENHKSIYENIIIYINSIAIDLPRLNKTFNVNDLSDFRSQVSIKNKMKELVKNTPNILWQQLNRQKFINSTIAEGPINLDGLQKSLKDNEKLDTAIIETHRRGNPVNIPRSNPNTNCHMYKSKLSTIFDLNASSEMKIMEIRNIIDNHSGLTRVVEPTVIADEPPPIDIVRFFGNYFPNSFSIFIRRSELFNLNVLKGIINNYYNKFKNEPDSQKLSDDHSRSILSNIFGLLNSFDFTTLSNEKIATMLGSTNQIFVQDFFENSTDETIYLLHMFTDIDSGNPTFSLQKDAVTADQVTMELFGIKKRNCLSLSSVKSLNNSLLFLSRIKSKITRDCHIIYAKTCGDGVAIEFVKILSYIYKQFIGLLSSDVCCDYRNLFENGYSIRQAPSKLAGTGLGLFAKTRQIEIYKNIEINAPSILTNINKILEKFNNINLFCKGTETFKRNYTNVFIITVAGLFRDAQKSEIINSIKDIIEQIKSYINETFDINIDLPKNEYLNRIFNISINKFGFDVYYNVCKELEKYTQLLEYLNTFTIDTITNPNICNDIKNLCSSPVLIHDATDQIKFLVVDFMNRFINLDLLISKFNQNVLSSRESVDESIENNFKIIASMENLLETIITDNKQEVKILTLYKLIDVIYPKPGKDTLGPRVINKYITNIINKIQEFSEMKENINSQELYDDSFDCLDYFKQYERILSVFNDKYLVRLQESQYLERQKIKQPLNLLKYILRALKAKELLSGNEFNYTNLKNIYPEVIIDLQSAQPTPAPSQQFSQQQFSLPFSPGQGSDVASPAPAAALEQAPALIVYTENVEAPPTPQSPISINQRNNIQVDEEDISTILSPLDDNEVNRFDMDENEISDFYTENNLDFNDKEKNLKTLIADGINNNMDPDKLFDYVISEKTANNENINLDEGSITKVKQAIQQRLGSAFGFLKNQIVRINDLISKPLKQTRENIPEIGGKKSRKYKRHKKNTIRKK